MSYWSKGDAGLVTSWGASANEYTTLLSGLTATRATVFVGSDTIDVTGLNAKTAANIPGLKSVRVSIQGYMGSTPYLGNAGLLSYDTGGYALHVPAWTWRASSAVHDITEFSSSSAVKWRSFMPDIFQAACSFTAGIDSATGVVLPPDAGTLDAALPTITLNYSTTIATATLAAKAVIQSMGATIAVRNKNLAAYSVTGTGSWVSVGGIWGSKTFASAANLDPLWSVGSTPKGPMVVTAVSGRTYSLADSFWVQNTITANVGAPVAVGFEVQGTGVLTVA